MTTVKNKLNNTSCFNCPGFIAGVDEAGRGPLFGPVVAAAVILDPNHSIDDLQDSKKLSPTKRFELSNKILDFAIGVGIGQASVKEIDSKNILQATMLAMQRAVNNLITRPHLVLIDGNKCPNIDIETKAIVKGDSKFDAIAAASIIAKVTRDNIIVEFDKKHPEYGFRNHKGYPVKAHLKALKEFGPLPGHRRSFKPVAMVLK